MLVICKYNKNAEEHITKGKIYEVLRLFPGIDEDRYKIVDDNQELYYPVAKRFVEVKPNRDCNILLEFEKRYKGDPSMTMEICGEIAKEFGRDVEEIADFVYLNRYSDSDSLDSEETEEVEE